MENTFELLSKVNVNERIKTKLGLSYLSWADAWNLLKKNCPDADWKIYTRTVNTSKTIETVEDGVTTKITIDEGTQEIPYFTDGNTCFVKVGLTISGVEYIEYYPIMDLKNNSMKLRNVGFTDVNKAIQRAFVKCAARHGLGLYIYTGEDFPEDEKVEVFELSNKDDFESVKNDVIKLIQAISVNDKKVPEMSRYVKEVFGETRISLTTEKDLDNLKLTRTYLNELYLGE